MNLDEGAGGWILNHLVEDSKVPEKLMTPDGKYYIQPIEDHEIILVPKDHPLMTMSDEEFAKIIDDPYWTMVAKAVYEKYKVKV